MLLRRARGGPGSQVQFASTPRIILRTAAWAILFVFALAALPARAATIAAIGSDGRAVTGFRWQLEEDRTHLVVPGAPDPAAPSLAFHPSAMPLAASGRVSDGSGIARVTLDPARRYFLTVLPDSGYTLGGLALAGTQTTATVTVAPLPLAAGQLSVLVYQDNAPLNGRPDLPVEPGLPGFTVRLFDAAGLVTRDSFGQPLGTSYDAAGNVLQPGQGFVMTGAGGEALIKNLPHGKYTVRVTPPDGEGWVQTSSREGGTGTDAWVRPGEPAFNLQFGAPGYHAAVGFTRQLFDRDVLRGGAAVRGRVFALATPLAGAWVGLNEPGGRCAFAAPCDGEGKFKIASIPAGVYQLAIWDEAQDVIFTVRQVTVASSDLYLGLIYPSRRFAQVSLTAFNDVSQNGAREPGEQGIAGVTVNLRRRDGSRYQTGLTGADGAFTFSEVFPFASWLVAEFDAARYKTTSPLTSAFQAFGGSALAIAAGKTAYPPGANGGIHGMVAYAVTRAEDDPRTMKIEPWEPGIPRVPVFLYATDTAGAIADTSGNGRIELGSVTTGGVVTLGDAIACTTTDAWDDHPPTEGGFDGWGAMSQVRPGIYDGAYRFTTSKLNGGGPLPPGTYIVQVVPPPGYEVVKEEDKNAGFGESYSVIPFALPAEPAGDPHRVPAQLTLFPGIACKLAGQTRPLCDRKRVTLNDGMNAQADFELFTAVPPAGHLVGRLHDDLAAETDPASPNRGGKHAPPWLPVSIQDAAGREVARVYADAWGTFTALVPSTFSTNIPSPLGVAPAVYTAVINSPGPIRDTDAQSKTFGQLITDPFCDPRYAATAYTFSATPAVTTYLDAPLERLSAFADAEAYPPDLNFADATPLIASAAGPSGGPYVAQAGQAVTLTAVLRAAVPNPLYTGLSGAQPPTVTRDYGFGASTGAVYLGGTPLKVTQWSNGSITATIPAGAASGQLTVVRAGGAASPSGVTLTVGSSGAAVRYVRPSASPNAHPIQDAIDAAAPGDLILVAPGRYRERVILWKPLRLQGWGAAATILDAAVTPDAARQWREKLTSLVNSGAAELLPGQTPGLAGGAPATLVGAEGAGILVLARNAPAAQGGFAVTPRPRIDGLTVTGASGGAIVINGYARTLEVSNTILTGNAGLCGGGIRAGDPKAGWSARGLTLADSQNTGLFIHHNLIRGNGAREGGGAITLAGGCGDYRIAYNVLTGNFSQGGGGAIAHTGLSSGGRIDSNFILFNQALGSGGGVEIAGPPPTIPWLTGAGAGAVKITGNLIQGNQAGGNGGGISLDAVSGQDVAAAPGDPLAWSAIDVTNNAITNNQAGLAAGGVALHDAARVNLIHNTIARNESTATAEEAFTPDNPARSTPLPAGVVSFNHSAALRAAFSTSATLARIAPFATCANPALINDIIWQNRSLYFDKALTSAAPAFTDLAVLGSPGAKLTPQGCLLTDAAGFDAANRAGDPAFVASYFNTAPGQSPSASAPLPTAAAAVSPDGARVVEVRFGPLSLLDPAARKLYADVHLTASSAALGMGAAAGDLLPELALDLDGQPRPSGAFEAGADEYYATPTARPLPCAAPDFFSLQAGSTLTVPAPGVLVNDIAASGGTPRALLTSAPSHGILALDPEGSFTYSPQAGFTGDDAFTYQLGDGYAVGAATAVTLHVLAQRPTPAATCALAYSTPRGQTLSIPAPGGILARVDRPTGDTLLALPAGDPSHGTVTLRPNGAFTYVPNVNFTGDDTFIARVIAGAATRFVVVTVHVTAPANHRPAPSAAALVTPMEQPIQTRILPNDPDPGDTFTYAITLDGLYGRSTVTPTGVLTYTPIQGYTGPDLVTVKVTDQAGASAPLAIPVLVTTAPPTAGGVHLQFQSGSGNVLFSLGAGDGFVKMADGRLVYHFGFSDLTGVANDRVMPDGIVRAQWPGSALTLAEGQNAFINLTNLGLALRPDRADIQSWRLLGFPQAAPLFTGSADSGPAPLPGNTMAYYFEARDPGTYPYQGNPAAEQAQMGLAGTLAVTPRQNGKQFAYPAGSSHIYTQFAYNDGDGSTGYDKDFTLQIGGLDPDFHDAELAGQAPPPAGMNDRYPLLNGRGYPDTVTTGSLPALIESLGHPSQTMTALVEAKAGQRILLRLANVNATRGYTLASAGIPMLVVGQNARLLRSAGGENLYYKTMSLTTGPAESYDVILDTTAVPAGTYFLYTTNLNYLSNNQEDFGGMMTEIVVH